MILTLTNACTIMTLYMTTHCELHAPLGKKSHVITYLSSCTAHCKSFAETLEVQ